MAERLYKTVSIAHSGCQEYMVNEPSFAAFGLGAAPADLNKSVVIVYRPATVIAAGKDLFAKQPFVLTHDGGMVDPENFQNNVRGWTGDGATLKWTDDGEVTVVTPLTILDQEAIDQYESGIREVSPGYGGAFRWSSGVAPNGTEYDIIMDKITWVNHVALVERGRGGQSAAILDHKGDNAMKKGPKTGLLHSVIRKLGIITDAAPDKFRDKVQKLIADRAVMDEDALGGKIEELKAAIASLPEGDEKSMLVRLIEDLPLAKEQPDEVANAAGEAVADKYDELDGKAMAEMPDKPAVKDIDVAPAAGAGDVPAKPAPVAAGGESAKAPVKAPVETGTAIPAVSDVGAIRDLDPAEWSPEQVHAIMRALVKLIPEEAQEPEHADIKPELEQAAAAGEPVAPAAGEQPVEGEDKPVGDEETDKEKDKPKVIGDSLAYFSGLASKAKPAGKSAFEALCRGDNLKK
jgi:hypothetical protein